MSGTLRLRGATSGYSELQAPAVAADQTFILPTAGGTLLTTDSPVPKLTLELGSASQPSLTFEGDTDTGLYSSGTNTLNLVTGGNNRLTIDSSGNVGIGTTSPSQPLTVGGVARFENFIEFAGSISTPATAAAIYRPADNNLAFSTASTERMRIDSSGNVGIGRTSPAQNLDVASTNNIAYALDGWALAGKGDSSDILLGGILGSQFDTLKVYTSGSERMRIDSYGRVGVGIIAPNADLHVKGGNFVTLNLETTGGSTNQLLFTRSNGGAATTEAIVGHASGNSDFYLQNELSGALLFGTNATERMRIDSSGRLLVGTTTEGFATFGDNLTIADSGHCGVTIRSGTSSQGNIYFSDGSSGGSEEYEGIIQYLHDVNAMAFGVNNGSERMRIDSSGRLLVGTTVEGQYPNAEALTVANNGHCGITVRSTSSTTGNLFFSDATSGTGEYSGAIVYDHSNDDLKLYTNGGQERLRIDSSGNVGIGTNSPEEILHIAATSEAVNTRDGVTLESTSSLAADTGLPLVFSADIGGGFSNYGIASIAGRKENATSVNAAGYLQFATGSSAGEISEKMRIDSSGQVLIGCTTFTSSTPGASIQNSANTSGRINLVKTATGARDALALYHAGSYVGGIVYTDTQTALVGSSDYRLKENIIDLEHAVDRIKNLSPKRFNFLVEPNKTIDGFIAHEVQDVVPEAVFGEKDGDKMQAIDQSKLIPLLTAALQEAIAKIETLETKVAALEAG